MNAVIAPSTDTLPVEAPSVGTIPLSEFVADFGDSLLEAVSRQNPPIDDGVADPRREAILDRLTRSPFPAQRAVVHAVARLLIDQGERAAIVNAECGTGKTMMAIAVATVLQAQGYRRTLVVSPPHLVYKWRREILETVPDARVQVLNGPDTLGKLLSLKANRRQPCDGRHEFFVLGRVRMRLGFHWRAAFAVRNRHLRDQSEDANPRLPTRVRTLHQVACPRCGEGLFDEESEPVTPANFPVDRRARCEHCGEPLWSLVRPKPAASPDDSVRRAICRLPTIGPKTADRLLARFGAERLGGMLDDNVFEFVNLMDADGELVFSDRQANRLQRALSTTEIGLGQGGFQATEFIKNYLPQGFFDLLVLDEGHEFKSPSSAQGQAMGVLAAKARKCLLLTGTLMGGYADDIFHLLWRLMPQRMIEDGFRVNARGSLGPAAMAFMREHGVLKDIYKEVDSADHRTAKGTRTSVHTTKAPGFGPKGIARYVLPFTAFLKLNEIGGNVLPPYEEHFIDVMMTEPQADAYGSLATALKEALRDALRHGDKSLLGVVLNALLAWPDTCFREEAVKHPRSRQLLHYTGSVFGTAEVMPKEAELIRLCETERERGRRVLAYTVYTGTRDTAARLKGLLSQVGFKAAVLRASVDTSRREDWIADQVERGVEVLIANPELVKTGLDLLDFPTLAFLQSGYNVYTLQQASRRSWRIGQTEPVDVHFLGYQGTAQIACLKLMAQKIAVAQSTAGEMPDTGLDVLNQGGDSVEVALAKQLVH
jgi:hypothetical protein